MLGFRFEIEKKKFLLTPSLILLFLISLDRAVFWSCSGNCLQRAASYRFINLTLMFIMILRGIH